MFRENYCSERRDTSAGRYKSITDLRGLRSRRFTHTINQQSGTRLPILDVALK